MPVGSDTQLQGLVDLAKKGDKAAKALLIDHACERLLKLTRKMFHGFPGLRRWEQTDDVFQNSLIRLHRALSAVEVESVAHFFNLAAEMVRRELLDLKKHHFGPHGRGANHHTDHQPPDEVGGSLSRTADEPEDLSMWGEFHERVGRLSEEHRQLVNMLFYEGLTQEEVAAILGISTRTLKRRWQDAKQQLHEKICDESG